MSPEHGLWGLFAASFLASTIVPFSSEAVLFGYLKLYPHEFGAAILVATLGNTLGGLSSYWFGRLLPVRIEKKLAPRALEKLRRYGSPLTFFAWLPIVGDALCVGAGWLRLNWVAVTIWMTAGRVIRYWVVAQGALI
ncbi:MAG: DedA family protein [Betaproteobacteria bacterium]|nr:DedA family protein [Betaproteobacteria bacterium]